MRRIPLAMGALTLSVAVLHAILAFSRGRREEAAVELSGSPKRLLSRMDDLGHSRSNERLKHAKRAWWTSRRWRSCLGEWRARRTRQRLEAVLQDPRPPKLIEDGGILLTLQSQFGPLAEYGYDEDSCWKRGVERSRRMVELLPILRRPGRRCLEVGCGDGMTGVALESFGHTVEVLDTEDWRDGRARHLRFHRGDICGGIRLTGGLFDVVFSYNTFEHLQDPNTALEEIVRILKPGGEAFLSFGPLFWSPWGLHAFETLFVPYPQVLFSEDVVKEALDVLGIRDLGMERDALQPLNGWRSSDFERLWRDSGCRVEHLERIRNTSHLDILLENPETVRGRNLSFDDLTVYGQQVVLVKRGTT